MNTWVNGASSTRIDVTDRGLHYGDGLFETMAVIDGRIRLLERHLARLLHGAERLGIVMPDNVDVMLREKAAVSGTAILKLIVTRGAGGRGYTPPAQASPGCILMTYPWPSVPTSMTLRVCETRLGHNPALAGIKHLNRLEQVLASREWSVGETADDGVMLDTEERVIETTRANLFIVSGGKLLTPQLDGSGVRGVMRDHVIDVAVRNAIECSEAALSLDDLHNADEIFVTNAVIGVCPVTALGQHRFPIGRMTARIATALQGEDKHPCG
ncbi:MAG: aminodeoxychorismate lyase [Gammaproteobacteria bacterium]|nr:aminodeoxychorismate lyase [Gammaproteobacteria bacterium]